VVHGSSLGLKGQHELSGRTLRTKSFLLFLFRRGVEPRVRELIEDFLGGASNVRKRGTSGLTAHSNRNLRLPLVIADIRQREYDKGRGVTSMNIYLCQIIKTRKRS